MMTEILKQIKTAVMLLALFTVLAGIIYPGFITVVAQLFFHQQANGSIIYKDGKPIGSLYIGQYFSTPNYFWGRPSATTPFPYNAMHSSGSNLAPSNPDLLTALKNRVSMIKNSGDHGAVPVDLVTASASGLDPDISPAAAYYQIKRIAKSRGISAEKIRTLVDRYAQERTWGVFGEPRVNVLELNLALDKLGDSEGANERRTS